MEWRIRFPSPFGVSIFPIRIEKAKELLSHKFPSPFGVSIFPMAKNDY